MIRRLNVFRALKRGIDIGGVDSPFEFHSLRRSVLHKGMPALTFARGLLITDPLAVGIRR